MMELGGRRALVCGASKGIGRAAANALAELGPEITVLARSASALEEVATALRDRGCPQARVLVADLDDRPALVRALGADLATHGPVHIVVNNTGGPAGGPLIAATEADLLAAFGRHVLAAHAILQLVLPGMRAAGYGRFVNVLSTSVREPIDNLGVSNTIRGAMASWAKTVSRELPPGVTINNVLPGFTDTERLDELAEGIAAQRGCTPEDVRAAWLETVPEGRLAAPEEVGAAIAVLASPVGGYIRGVSLPVDGGRLRSI